MNESQENEKVFLVGWFFPSFFPFLVKSSYFFTLLYWQILTSMDDRCWTWGSWMVISSSDWGSASYSSSPPAPWWRIESLSTAPGPIIMVELKTGMGNAARGGRISRRRGFSFFLLFAGLLEELWLRRADERDRESGEAWFISPEDRPPCDRSIPIFIWRRDGEPLELLNEFMSWFEKEFGLLEAEELVWRWFVLLFGVAVVVEDMSMDSSSSSPDTWRSRSRSSLGSAPAVRKTKFRTLVNLWPTKSYSPPTPPGPSLADGDPNPLICRDSAALSKLWSFSWWMLTSPLYINSTSAVISQKRISFRKIIGCGLGFSVSNFSKYVEHADSIILWHLIVFPSHQSVASTKCSADRSLVNIETMLESKFPHRTHNNCWGGDTAEDPEEECWWWLDTGVEQRSLPPPFPPRPLPEDELWWCKDDELDTGGGGVPRWLWPPRPLLSEGIGPGGWCWGGGELKRCSER